MPITAPQPIETPVVPVAPRKPSRKKRVFWIIFSTIVAIILGAAGASYAWYQQQLQPVDARDTSRQLVTIEAGSTPRMIGQTLKEANVIRSETAFSFYTRLNGVQNTLQAGTYRLSASESLAQVVEHLTKGNVDTFQITFLPGATLADHKKVLLEAGYTEAEIEQAFEATYTGVLFEGRPAGSDLEGYIFGETYQMNSGASVEDVLKASFAQFTSVIEREGLVDAFRAQGLTLYQGLTLASIIQREAGGGDEAQIAQVFYTRLSIDMPLGSDVTYQYIADKTGVARDTNLDSPYNTRRYQGLPPGPIASPGVAALKGAAAPAQGDYVYFLSGDDDVTYFARTLAEHEANIAAHCRQKCQII